MLSEGFKLNASYFGRVYAGCRMCAFSVAGLRCMCRKFYSSKLEVRVLWM